MICLSVVSLSFLVSFFDTEEFRKLEQEIR